MAMHRIDQRSPGSNHPTRRSRLSSAWRQVLKLLGSLSLGWTAATMPSSVAAAESQAPEHWLSYAQLVSNQFQAWLSDSGNETVVRLHTFMQDRMLQEGTAAPPPALVVRVWIAGSGQVERLEFSSLGTAQADADLRSLLTSVPLSEPPPPDMRQPMILQLDLTFVTAV